MEIVFLDIAPGLQLLVQARLRGSKGKCLGNVAEQVQLHVAAGWVLLNDRLA